MLHHLLARGELATIHMVTLDAPECRRAAKVMHEPSSKTSAQAKEEALLQSSLHTWLKGRKHVHEKGCLHFCTDNIKLTRLMRAAWQLY